MNIIKLFEEFISFENNTIRYKAYTLTEETDDSSDEIHGVWYIKEDAIEEAECHTSVWEDRDSSINLHIYKLEIPLGDILSHYDIDDEEYNSDKKYYNEDFITDVQWNSYIVDNDEEHIKDLPYKNASTDDMINDVIDKLNVHFDRTWRNGFSKYTTLYKDGHGNLTFDDDNGLEYDDPGHVGYEQVNIRIADHTHNPRNGSNDLNVLICNKNATSGRFYGARTDLNYDEDSDIDDIVNDIINYWK